MNFDCTEEVCKMAVVAFQNGNEWARKICH